MILRLDHGMDEGYLSTFQQRSDDADVQMSNPCTDRAHTLQSNQTALVSQSVDKGLYRPNKDHESLL